ncbi:BPSL0067 family protein [Paraburkholderia xenovorans]|uniref:BPSL0067 family protein n=1 Tax=Paraburkholderia xenovorans TaxID=36873 RepID=UPI0038BC17DD
MAYVTVVCPSLPVAVAAWKKGAAVKGNRFVREGTVIATFSDSGKFYGHAAIYVREAANGIVVWDQYDTPIKGIGERTLRWNSPTSVNNGNFFYVVE